MSKFSKWEPRHEHKHEPQDIAQHKSYLYVLCNMYALLLMDNLMYNFLQNGEAYVNKYVWSLESKSSHFTIITVLSLILSIVCTGMFDSRNAETASKPNAAYVTTIPS